MKTLYRFAKTNLFRDLYLTVRLRDGSCVSFPPVSEKPDGDSVVLRYDASWFRDLTVRADFGTDCILFSICADLRDDDGIAPFAPNRAVSITLGGRQPDRMLAYDHENPWWTMPYFPAAFAELHGGSQQLLCEIAGLHYHMLPLCGTDFRCEAEAGILTLTSGMPGLKQLRGPFLSLAVSEDPLAAVEQNYRGARALGGISVPLRAGRVLPEFFRSFGWCTWDSFYKEVTSEKIYQKLAEFREKEIPVRWMLIDDGWMTVDGRKLADFKEDPAKFPEGLKATVARIKQEYGVEKVGVWHAFNGYWDGVAPDSPLFREQIDNLTRTACGLYLPSDNEEKAFRFWDAWHGYLAECGVDFLKIDNQSSNSRQWEGTHPTAEACRRSHNSIERSINKHFAGAVINCMGMDMENALARPGSAISRNSNDFFPGWEDGFRHHLVQNAYNAIWHQQLYFCDFDMWWSSHISAVQNGVLRAISGSPVYVSDKIGQSDAGHIRPVVEPDGTVMMCDAAARPLPDFIYGPLDEKQGILPVWNRSGDAFALAAFNIRSDTFTETIDFGAIPGLSPDLTYIAYEYFSGTYQKLGADRKRTVTLEKDGVAVWSIYPVLQPEDPDSAYILRGDPACYVPIASAHKRKVLLADLPL